MSTSIKVAVRVRPFNEREEKQKCACIVQMQDNKTILLNKKGDSSNSRREFTYDHSYWSHTTDSSHYVSQEKVFNDLGSSVVTNSLEGYNACVFAYGQTGSGKTFTMMGSESNPGLIPRICQTLFSCIEKERETGTTFKVEVSYLEIYNEKLRDLLRNDKSNKMDPKQNKENNDLKLRGTKNETYVENLTHHNVSQYSDVEKLMQRGNKLRTTAATKMNNTSSRSHAVFTITFTQAKLQADIPLETRSKIHLVDLAGSERADATGATGTQLRESGHINRSLTVLGKVIDALENRSKEGKEIHIPYRESYLTLLLQDSLGGNSKTIMIATISPADVNYGETLSTLQYARRANGIKNTPTINEDPNVKLIRELRAEIDKLKSMVKLDNVNLVNGGGIEEGSIRDTLFMKEAQEKELTHKWNEKWRQTQSILQEQCTLELRKTSESERGVVLDSERPHLILLDDVCESTGITLYHLNEEITTIGSSQDQDIQLKGQDMMNEHCIIRLKDGNATLEITVDANVSINEKLVENSTSLKHRDRILIGGSHIFRYNDPQEAARLKKAGNRSSVNLSLFDYSYLSKSTTDLHRSNDVCSRTNGLEEPRCNESKIENHFDSLKIETGCCEISTQTSAGTQSYPSTPYASEFPQLYMKKKSSLTLPLEGNLERSDSSPMSFNSTPASDTFYTATSVLTPDVSDLLSPLSPITNKEIENSEHTRQEEPSSILDSMACASFVCSPKRPLARFLNSSDVSNGITTSTPKRNTNNPTNNGNPVDEDANHINVDNELCDKLDELKNVTGCSILPSEDPHEYDTSELIHDQDNDIKIDHVLETLFSNEKGDRSILVKQKELEDLQHHYSTLESELLEEFKSKNVDEENGKEKKERPNQLALNNLLKKRVVLMIEKEVRRRVAEEKKCTLQEHEEFHCPCGNRMIRSASPNSLRSIPSTLSPFEMRPHSSMSADCYENGIHNVIYERSLSEDLFSSVPLSPLDGEYDMSCGICVSLPSFDLRGSGSTAHWEYHVRLSVGKESWLVFRRYRRFRELRLYMSKKYGSVIEDLYFPPRRIFGNHSLAVIEGRRRELEVYLQQLITLCGDMEGSPLCDVTKTRKLLEEFSPFFRLEVSDLNRRYSTS